MGEPTAGKIQSNRQVRGCGRFGDLEGGGSSRNGEKEINLWYILEEETSVITEVRKGKNQSNWRDGRFED